MQRLFLFMERSADEVSDPLYTGFSFIYYFKLLKFNFITTDVVCTYISN
jgi:hypothetical protein